MCISFTVQGTKNSSTLYVKQFNYYSTTALKSFFIWPSVRKMQLNSQVSVTSLSSLPVVVLEEASTGCLVEINSSCTLWMTGGSSAEVPSGGGVKTTTESSSKLAVLLFPPGVPSIAVANVGLGIHHWGSWHPPAKMTGSSSVGVRVTGEAEATEPGSTSSKQLFKYLHSAKKGWCFLLKQRQHISPQKTQNIINQS